MMTLNCSATIRIPQPAKIQRIQGALVNWCQRRAFDSSKRSDPGLTDVEDGGMMANSPP
jgi:hypothetical protein